MAQQFKTELNVEDFIIGHRNIINSEAPDKPVTATDKPTDKPTALDWPKRLTDGRDRNGWAQRDAINALRELADEELPDTTSMLRMWRRWETGENEPGNRYASLLDELFGETFPVDENEDLTQLAAQIRDSIVSVEDLEAMQQRIDQLCMDYRSAQPTKLRLRVASFYRELESMLDRRTSLESHQRLLELAGWGALLLSTLSHDLGESDIAEQIRRTALKLGHDINNESIIGWAHEIRVWISLTRQEWNHAIAASQAGQQHLSDHEPTGVFVQLATQEAEAWARLGDLKEMNRSLGAAQLALERHPEPTNPEHHFVLDHAKFDWMTMRCLLLAGENDRAAKLADRLEREFTNPDGTLTNPMRISEIESSRALVALRRNDLDKAIEHANKAIDIPRRSKPSLLRATDLLANELEHHQSTDKRIYEFLARRTSILG